jgi:hypothetical protein
MNRRVPVLDRDTLSVEIAGLSKASIKDLRERWKTLYGKEPSGHIGRSFLIRVIAYRLPEKAFGGLKPSTRRLARSGRRRHRGRELAEEHAGSKGGTILVREWQGAVHRATVLGDGVSFNGKRYRSLSELAREITGSRWLARIIFSPFRTSRERRGSRTAWRMTQSDANYSPASNSLIIREKYREFTRFRAF